MKNFNVDSTKSHFASSSQWAKGNLRFKRDSTSLINSSGKLQHIFVTWLYAYFTNKTHRIVHSEKCKVSRKLSALPARDWRMSEIVLQGACGGPISMHDHCFYAELQHHWHG